MLGTKSVVELCQISSITTCKGKFTGPLIEDYAKIGANVTILPGKVIGAHALIGAGSVIVDDVPPGKVVVGNPGKNNKIP